MMKFFFDKCSFVLVMIQNCILLSPYSFFVGSTLIVLNGHSTLEAKANPVSPSVQVVEAVEAKTVHVKKSVRAFFSRGVVQHKISNTTPKINPNNHKILHANHKLQLPTEIKTKSMGFVEISLNGDFLLRIGPNTTVFIEQLKDQNDQPERSKVSLISGKIWLKGARISSKNILLSLPLLEPIEISGSHSGEWSFDQSRFVVRILNLSQVSLDLRSLGQGSPPIQISMGEWAEFTAETDPNGQVKIDKILADAAAVVGSWKQGKEGAVSEVYHQVEKSWAAVIAQAEKAHRRRLEEKSRRQMIKKGLCANPVGNFNQCLYRRVGGGKIGKSKGVRHRANGNQEVGQVCERLRCLANGQWGAPFQYPSSSGPCEANPFVGPCDY